MQRRPPRSTRLTHSFPTRRSSDLVCASDLFGSWFEGHPTPPDLTLDGNGGERLATAGRAAWRDGVGKVHGLRKGALMVDVEITRTGQSEDYLLWRFMPVKQANIIDDYTRLLVGEAGRQFTDAGIMGVRSEEHTSELQSLMRISYAVFCLNKKQTLTPNTTT